MFLPAATAAFGLTGAVFRRNLDLLLLKSMLLPAATASFGSAGAAFCFCWAYSGPSQAFMGTHLGRLGLLWPIPGLHGDLLGVDGDALGTRWG